MPHQIVYKGRQYDIEGFINKHPGGAALLLDCKDCDITEVVQSYHPAKTLGRVDKILEGLPSSIPSGAEGMRNFAAGEKTIAEKNYIFSKEYTDARDKLYNAKLPTVDPFDLIFWGCLACFFIGISWMFPDPNSTLAQVCDGIFKGLAMVVGGGYGHQYVHLSSPKASVITLAGFHCNVWRYEHVFSHHPYTNTPKDIDLVDFTTIDDIPLFPLLKYMLVSSVIVVRPYIRYVIPKFALSLTRWDWLAVAYNCWDVYFNFGISWLLKKHIVAGWFLLIDYFNHYKECSLVRDSDFWDQQQIAASRNFIVSQYLYDNHPFIHSLFCFGLDRQVEHHLFPRLKMEHLGLVKYDGIKAHKVGWETVRIMCQEFVWVGAH